MSNFDKMIAVTVTDGNGDPSQSLLEKLESKGCSPHTSCRDGFCGACRVTVLKGQTEHFKDPLGYTNKDAGEILSCISRIVSDDVEVGFN